MIRFLGILCLLSLALGEEPARFIQDRFAIGFWVPPRTTNNLPERYREIREAHDWGKRFPEQPSGSVIEKLALLTPREMRRAVQAAFGNAKVSGRDELRPEDVDIQRGSRKSRIGF